MAVGIPIQSVMAQRSLGKPTTRRQAASAGVKPRMSSGAATRTSATSIANGWRAQRPRAHAVVAIAKAACARSRLHRHPHRRHFHRRLRCCLWKRCRRYLSSLAPPVTPRTRNGHQAQHAMAYHGTAAFTPWTPIQLRCGTAVRHRHARWTLTLSTNARY